MEADKEELGLKYLSNKQCYFRFEANITNKSGNRDENNRKEEKKMMK